jgi:hypothetical protein
MLPSVGYDLLSTLAAKIVCFAIIVEMTIHGGSVAGLSLRYSAFNPKAFNVASVVD